VNSGVNINITPPHEGSNSKFYISGRDSIVMIQQVLREIGLTQNEVKVYSALLELGESKTGEILAKAGMNSGRIYEILNSLQEKGLVSNIVKNRVKYFSPADPKRVRDYLKEKKNQITKQEGDYDKILPQLMKKVAMSKEEAHIEIFTGFKGMKTAFSKELWFPKDELRVFGVTSREDYSPKLWDWFLHTHQPARARLGMKIRKLLGENARGEKGEHEAFAELRYLPYGHAVSINVVGNVSIIYINAGDHITITIESQAVADSFAKQFDMMWKIAKE